MMQLWLFVSSLLLLLSESNKIYKKIQQNLGKIYMNHLINRCWWRRRWWRDAEQKTKHKQTLPKATSNNDSSRSWSRRALKSERGSSCCCALRTRGNGSSRAARCAPTGLWRLDRAVSAIGIRTAHLGWLVGRSAGSYLLATVPRK